MKKKLYALSGVLLIVLVSTGLWASKAGGFAGAEQTENPMANSKVNGLSMQDMVAGSSAILYGTCVETKSAWIERGLVTLATVTITKSIKGDLSGSETVTVVLPGGIDGNRKYPVAMTYAGAPRMAPEEQVFLFLSPAPEVPNGYAVTGYNAGKFSIVLDVDDKPVVTSSPLRVRAPRVTGLTSGNSDGINLPEFEALVESYLR